MLFLLYKASNFAIKNPSKNNVFQRHLLFEVWCWFHAKLIDNPFKVQRAPQWDPKSTKRHQISWQRSDQTELYRYMLAKLLVFPIFWSSWPSEPGGGLFAFGFRVPGFLTFCIIEIMVFLLIGHPKNQELWFLDFVILCIIDKFSFFMFWQN